jgi:hypothetical protein
MTPSQGTLDIWKRVFLLIPAPSTLSRTTVLRRAVEELWNAQQFNVAEELIAPTYVNHGGLITDLVHGPEAILASVALFRRMFPCLTVMIESLECVGDLTVLHWRAVADGEVPVDDEAGIAGVLRAWIINGRIHESWMEWDRGLLLRHFGIRERELGEAPEPTGWGA